MTVPATHIVTVILSGAERGTSECAVEGPRECVCCPCCFKAFSRDSSALLNGPQTRRNQMEHPRWINNAVSRSPHTQKGRAPSDSLGARLSSGVCSLALVCLSTYLPDLDSPALSFLRAGFRIFVPASRFPLRDCLSVCAINGWRKRVRFVLRVDRATIDPQTLSHRRVRPAKPLDSSPVSQGSS